MLRRGSGACWLAPPLAVALASLTPGCAGRAAAGAPTKAKDAATDSGPAEVTAGPANDVGSDQADGDSEVPASPSEDAAAPPDAAAEVGDAASPTDAAPSAADAVATDAAKPPAPWLAKGAFVDVSSLLGGGFAVDAGNKAKNGPESSGAALGDVDGDATPDLVVHDGLTQVWLYRSLPKKPWKWFKEKVFTDKASGLRGLALHQTGPGDPVDIAVVGSHAYLLRYDPTSDSWKDQAAARGVDAGPMVSLQAVQPMDIDDDGLLDLTMTVFSCSKQSKLLAFVAQGDGSFAESASALGIDHDSSLWNVMQADVDGDGFLDLLTLAEDCDPKHGNAWLRNRGHPDSGKRYEYKSLAPLFLAPLHGGGSPMGGGIGDWNGDGKLDLFLSDIGLRDARMGGADIGKASVAQLALWQDGCNHLLLAGTTGYVSAAAQAGITNALSSTGLSMVSWSGLPIDIDADGLLDLAVSHGYDYGAFLLADEGQARTMLFRNLGNGSFEDRSKAVGLPDPFLGRALVLHDLDADGDLDLFLGGQGTPPRLYRNDIATGGHALQVRLVGSTSNVWGLGAQLTLTTTGRTLVATASVHSVSHGMASPIAHFAFPAGEAPVSLQVAWPSGFVQEVKPAVWPVDAAPLVVTEPPIVTLSERFIYAMDAAAVQVKARRFTPQGQPVAPTGVTISLAPGAQGSFSAPTQCNATECIRSYKAPSGQTGEAAIVVAVEGVAWKVRPRVRFKPPGL